MKKVLSGVILMMLGIPLCCYAQPSENTNSIQSTNNYFLSPHPDDVVLPFAGLIQSHPEFENKNNHIIVFFGKSNYSENGPNQDKSDKRITFITTSRIVEDMSGLNELFNGGKNYTYAFYGENDAPLRNYEGPKTAGGGPGGNFSNFRQSESDVFQRVYETIKPILMQDNCSVFVLSAVGSHIDHFIVREATIKAAHDLGEKATCQIYFGEDQPYTGMYPERAQQDLQKLIDRLHLQPITYKIDVDKKINHFANNYYTQYTNDYIAALRARAVALQNGERIYLWPKKYYSAAPTDSSCHESFCQLK